MNLRTWNFQNPAAAAADERGVIYSSQKAAKLKKIQNRKIAEAAVGIKYIALLKPYLL